MPSLVLSKCPDSATLSYQTTYGELYSLTYCPEGNHVMARSTTKTILFARATHGKVVRQWPVAVFNDTAAAKSYATFLKLAYKSQDDETIAVLDPSAFRQEDGTPVYDTKWSVTEVPYSPAPDFTEDETAEPAAA
jgi:hypothetical protein